MKHVKRSSSVRASASEVLSVAYGHRLETGNEADDRLLNASKGVMHYLADSITPNYYLVDAVPICESLIPTYLLDDLTVLVGHLHVQLNVVKFLPKWCPGMSFHREAEKCRKLSKIMVRGLYDEVVEKVVGYSGFLVYL
ncbi:hypothetical protein PTI98_012474 [Pleurotus ostreatus]|nr:hypothetical protein PTI98_012474 [Pleurotus ostreatus]